MNSSIIGDCGLKILLEHIGDKTIRVTVEISGNSGTLERQAQNFPHSFFRLPLSVKRRLKLLATYWPTFMEQMHRTPLFNIPTDAVAPQDILTAIQYQPLASLTPAVDAANLLPPFASNSQHPTLLNDLDPQSLLGLNGLISGELAADAQVLPSSVLGAVQNLLGSADTSYLRLKESSFVLPHRRPQADQHRNADIISHGSLAQMVLDFAASVQPHAVQTNGTISLVPQSAHAQIHIPGFANTQSNGRAAPTSQDSLHNQGVPLHYPTPASYPAEHQPPYQTCTFNLGIPPMNQPALPTPGPVYQSAYYQVIQQAQQLLHSPTTITVPFQHPTPSGKVAKTEPNTEGVVHQNVLPSHSGHVASPIGIGHRPASCENATGVGTPALPASIKRRRSSFSNVQVLIETKKAPASPMHGRNAPALDDDRMYTPLVKKRKVSTVRDDAFTPGTDWVKSIRKCVACMQAIFAAEDFASSPVEDRKDEKGLYFDEGGLLTANALGSLMKYLRRIPIESLPKLLEELGTPSLKRLLKILEARLRDSEFLHAPVIKGCTAPRTPKKKVKRKSVSEAAEDDTGIAKTVPQGPNDDATQTVEPAQFEQILDDVLTRAEISIDACSVALLLYSGVAADTPSNHGSGDKIFSEDLMMSVLNLLKTQLNETLYAILELAAKEGDELTTPMKATRAICEKTKMKNRLALFASKIADVLTGVCGLLDLSIFGDDIVIPFAFIAVSPFFVETSTLANVIGLEKIQSKGIDICRTIASRHPKHRNFILEEICTNLIKLSAGKKTLKQYRLPDGKSVQMVSALVLQIIQSCCSGQSLPDMANQVTEALDRLMEGSKEPAGPSSINGAPTSEKKKKSKKETKNDEAAEGATARDNRQEHLQILSKFLEICKRQLDAASQCAHYFLKFMLSRCSQASDPALPKAEKGRGRRNQNMSNEAEYKAVLENFLKDSLTVLNSPEWPAAELTLMLFGRLMIQTLDDTKKQGDTAMRAMAVEWLGEIAARIRKRLASPPFTRATVQEWQRRLPGSDVNGDTPTDSLNILWGLQKVVLDWLDVARVDDSALLSAHHELVSQWGYAIDLKGFETWPDTIRATVTELVLEYCAALTHKTRPLCVNLAPEAIPLTESALSVTALDTRPAISYCLELLAIRHPLHHSFDQYMLRIGTALDSDVVTLRTKALKALQEIFIADSSVLGLGNVRKIIEARMMDQSTSVRDAAIELVGRFLINGGEEWIREYYPTISCRVLDVGTNVRKRIVRLLKDIYLHVAELEGEQHRKITVDIAAKLLGRLSDEEDSVKDLAFKTLQELWFAPFVSINVGSHTSVEDELIETSQAWGALPPPVRASIRKRALLMVEAVATLKSAPDMFSSLLRRYLSMAGKSAKKDIAGVCRSLVESLMEELLCLEERNDKEAARDVLVLLCQFSKIFPMLLTSHVKTLQPSLTPPSADTPQKDTAVDQRIKQVVITIVQAVIPIMRNPNLEEITIIENDLTRALNSGAQPLVAVAVPCLCVIISHVTKHYDKLTKLLKTCVEFARRTKQAVESNKAIPEAGWRGTWRCLLLVAQFVRYFDFDQNRDKLGDSTDLEKITPGSIISYVCELLLFFLSPQMNNATKAMALTALGHVFIAHPRLMLRSDSRTVMDTVLDGNVPALKIPLLKAFVEFLQNENRKDLEKKKTEDVSNKAVDIKVLIGNAEEMGDAGIGSSIMQMYLERILDCMMSTDQSLMAISFELVELILEQGLVHPLLCIPSIVAMEANSISDVRERAARLHGHLNEKHASFIHAKNIDGVRRMFEYLKLISHGRQGTSVLGYMVTERLGEDGSVMRNCEAYLGRLYSFVQTKRPRRNEFLTSMVKLMDVELTENGASRANVDFCRFIAENLSLLEYKTQEEVLHVIFYGYRVLSVTAETVLREIEAGETKVQTNEARGLSLPVVAKASLCMGMLLMLKTHLQTLYGLSATRISTFKPNDGPRAAEKPAVRAPAVSPIILWDRMPFANEKRMTTEEDFRSQCQQYKELMSADYVAGFEDGDIPDTMDNQDVPAQPAAEREDIVHVPEVSAAVTSAGNTPAAGKKGRRASTATGKKRNSVKKAPGTPSKKRKRKSVVNLNSDQEDDSAEDPNWG